MPETFVPMREWLKPAPEPAYEEEIVIEDPSVETNARGSELDPAIDDVKRFRAALADVVAACADELLRDIASEVLAREFELAPCDLEKIVAQAVARQGPAPARVRLNPVDAELFEVSSVPVVADSSLRRGDAVLETQLGTIDASLGVRLARVLERIVP